MTTSDDQLLALLGEALRLAEPVPDHLVDFARQSFTWRSIDADLAALVYDSADAELAGVRGEDMPRQITFQASDIEIEAMVFDDGDPTGARRLVGQLVPAAPSTIQLVSGTGIHTTSCDHLGRFSFDSLTSGPVRLCLLVSDALRTVHTDWVLL
jgi:hypothetical protein